MRKINKTDEPALFTQWKRRNPTKSYKDLGRDERVALRHACTEDQHYLCAYCCREISGKREDTMNEHVQPQIKAQRLTLDYQNIVASCKTPKQCDSAHDRAHLPLTPLMDECELEFRSNGRVFGRTPRAQKTIAALNLGDHEKSNMRLVGTRKTLFNNIIKNEGYHPDAPESLDDSDRELLEALADDLICVRDGRLDPYAPVLRSMLITWLEMTRS